MRQIAARVPCGLSTVVKTLKRFSETNFIVDRDDQEKHRYVKTGRLLEIGLRGCKARPKPLLTEFQRKRRLTWASEHSLWTIKDWEKLLDIMIVQFRNEKVSNHDSIPITIDCNVVAFIDFEEVWTNDSTSP
ncbi:hypothetical protein TNCV_655281 [Trichonephila clavipes]|nr:hypothetical protein TNCV_655281 [Trichonephila clavipes]